MQPPSKAPRSLSLYPSKSAPRQEPHSRSEVATPVRAAKHVPRLTVDRGPDGQVNGPHLGAGTAPVSELSLNQGPEEGGKKTEEK